MAKNKLRLPETLFVCMDKDGETEIPVAFLTIGECAVGEDEQVVGEYKLFQRLKVREKTEIIIEQG